jgi:zinc transporter ZupT
MSSPLPPDSSLHDETSAAFADDDDHDESSVGTLKFVLTCCILAMGFLSVFAPRRLTGKPAIFSLGNMMASGVLLAAGLVHQLADSAQILNKPERFPWAMFIAGFTFLMFMVVEESIHLMLGEHGQDLHDMMHGGGGGGGGGGATSNGKGGGDSHNNHSHQHSHQHSHSHSHQHAPSSSDDDDEGNHSFSLPTNSKHLVDNDYNTMDGEVVSSELQPLAVHRHSASTVGPDGSCARLNMSCSTIVPTAATAPFVLSAHSNHSMNANTTNTSRRPSQFGSFLQSNKSHKEDPFMLTEHHHHDDHIDLHLHGSILASGILMMALSIHSILAGISIGIETQADSITGTAIAILAHKSFEGFCLGSSLVTAQLDHFPFMVLGISFSLATPLGIVLGQLLIDVWIDNMSGPRGDATIAVIQAIVAGTFLYIAIVEIGAKELLACRHEVVENDASGKGQQRYEAAKLACFVIGFLAMSSLAVVL